MAERSDEIKAQEEAIARQGQGDVEGTLTAQEMAATTEPLAGTGDVEAMADQIRQTRRDTQKTWHSIRERISPQKFRGQAQEKFRTAVVERARNFGESAGQSVRDMGNRMAHNMKGNIIPAALVGLGLAWLIRENRAQRARELGPPGEYDATPMGGYYDEELESPAAAYYGESQAWEEQATTMDQEIAYQEGRAQQPGKMRKAADALRERSQGIRRRMQSSGEETARMREQGRERGRQARQGFWEMVDRNPLGMTATAFALGAVVGLSIPEARREHELFGPRRDELLARADQARREAVGKAKQVAAHARDAAVEEARAQGLTPDDLKEKAQRVSERVEETVKEDTRSAEEKPSESHSEDFPGA